MEDRSSHLVWATVDNMNRIGVAIEALYAEMVDQLEKLDCIGRIKEIDFLEDSVGKGWAYHRELCRIGLHGPESAPDSEPLATLGILFDLWRPRITGAKTWPHAEEAVIYIGIAEAQNTWDFQHLGLTAHGTPWVPEKFRLAAPWLWEWVRELQTPDQRGWLERSCFFCVPLGRLADADAVWDNIVHPLGSLIQGKTPSEAFAGAGMVIQFQSSPQQIP